MVFDRVYSCMSVIFDRMNKVVDGKERRIRFVG